jgi:hypothetical protein
MDEWCAGQYTAHDCSLYTHAAAVDDAKSLQAQVVCFFEIDFHDIFDLLRLDTALVEDICDLNTMGFVILVHG